MSVFRSDLFTGKVCLVTGGGSGIGKAIATELVTLGATVVIASRSAERISAAAKLLNENIPTRRADVLSVPLNIRNEENVNTVMKGLIEKFGRVDVLVNNGGGQFASPAAGIAPKGWRAVIDTNLNGTWFMCQSLYANTEPLRRPGVSIINVTADFFNGFPGMAHTGAARAAVDNLTKTLAREWGPEGVRVNSVAPGIILSSGVNNYPDQYRGKFFVSGESVPLGRPGTESEIASAVVFLASPAARYITGATLRVDGGGSLSKTDFIDEALMSESRATDGVSTEARRAAVRAGVAPYHLTAALKSEFDQRMKLRDPPKDNDGDASQPPRSKL